RCEGPIFLTADGHRLDRHGAGRIVRRVARRAAITKPIEPHTLRHAFITAALDAGVPLRDVQEAASHADPRTTMRYDRARASLDRHATYIVAAYIAGAARKAALGSRAAWSAAPGPAAGTRRHLQAAHVRPHPRTADLLGRWPTDDLQLSRTDLVVLSLVSSAGAACLAAPSTPPIEADGGRLARSQLRGLRPPKPCAAAAATPLADGPPRG
ncbi:MAG TPA: tyrosine-type recombinase/integrase, partial [Trebonia sp.]|nr:tyrosine-type recombinase/integrase [Trebonia sp.]